jgi:hypothetical protein
MPGRVKQVVNSALTRATGYQLTRSPDAARRGKSPASGQPVRRVNRLVKDPTFILTSVRSGSTLLRVILNSHSMICAPHELHLRTLRVNITQRYGEESMQHLGLDQRSLEHLLWDRVLHRELTASGKRLIVDKTPNIVFEHERLVEAWPKARFIFLLRHPAAVAESLYRARKDAVLTQVIKNVADYAATVDAARRTLPGLTVRYEDLVTAPERVTAEVCSFLGVPWERTMLDYGDFDHGPLVPRIGDWKKKIRSGRIDSELVLPNDDDIPPELREACRTWGYL